MHPAATRNRPARSRAGAGLRVHHLNLLPCHSVFRGGNPLGDDSWHLLDYQRGSGEVSCFVGHIREAIRSLQDDKDALLVITGGVTRNGLHISESSSYKHAAQALGLLDDPAMLQRMALEEFARDSLENLHFGLCRFYEVVGLLPHKIRVFGFGFKRERFELHARALGIPPQAFEYVSVNEPQGLDAASRGEARALAGFHADPFGLAGDLWEKRLARSAFGHRPPYEFTCNSNARLRKLLWINRGAPPDEPCRTYAVHYRRQNGAPFKVIDARASGLLTTRLHELNYRRDCDIVEQPAREQVEDAFEQISDEQWVGSAEDHCFLRTVDLLLTTTRPPLDEDGRKTVRRTHTRLERQMLRVFRKFFVNCSRKNITLAPRFAALLPEGSRSYADIDFHVFDTRDEEEKESGDFMAEYKALSGDPSHCEALPEHCGRTCCYLAYSGTDDAIGCPVLAAFGLSGSDTYRFAAALTETRLGEVYEDVVAATGARDRLVMVECSRPEPDSPCDFEVILDEALEPATGNA